MANKLLVACEESQRVCTAFRNVGWDAFSCDVSAPSGGHLEWHIQQDVLPLLNGNCSFTTMDGTEHTIKGKWDMIIAFPPCTYLSNAGACRMFKRIDGDGDEWRLINLERLKLGMKGRDFFMAMLNADCEHIAVENPIPLSIYCLPDYAQIIHPYYFGEPYKKKTCLWLKGLPQLKKDNEVEPDMNWVNGGSKKPDGTARDIKTHGFRDAKNRSKTFVCVANAMARQWGQLDEVEDK